MRTEFDASLRLRLILRKCTVDKKTMVLYSLARASDVTRCQFCLFVNC